MNAKTMLGLAVVFSGGYLLPPWLQMQVDRGTARKVRASGTENWPDALEDPDRRIAHPTAPGWMILDSMDLATVADIAPEQDGGAQTGRDPALFLVPAPPENPPPGLVERFAQAQTAEVVQALHRRGAGLPSGSCASPADAADRQDEGHDTGAPDDASEGALGRSGAPPDPADLSADLDAEWGGCHG